MPSQSDDACESRQRRLRAQKLARYLAAFGLLLGLFLVTRTALADPKKVEKIRKFYREHNLDFFGDLVADQKDFLEDEKRQAKLELLADDARVKALEQLEKLLRGTKGPMEAELLIRKASLLSDRARTATFFQNSQVKSARLKDPKSYLRDSIAIFQKIERQFGTHPKMDVVLFTIAYNYGELRENDNAFRYYSRMTEKYPESPLVGDAQLSMAEILFEKRKFPDALKQLQAIVKAEHPRLKNFALYKMAWTYYNMADLESAVTSLERVVAGVNALGVQHARLELRKEALSDLVVIYSELPDPSAPKRARSYFEKTAATPDAIAAEYNAIRDKRVAQYKEKQMPIPDEDRPEFRVREVEELLLKLVQVYRDSGKHEAALAVAGEWIELLPKHPRTPPLYRLRAESFEKLRNRDGLMQELRRMAEVAAKDLPLVPEFEKGIPTWEIEPLPGYFAKLDLTKDKFPAVAMKRASTARAPGERSEEKRNLYVERLAQTVFESFRDFSSFLHGEWTKTRGADTAKAAEVVYGLAIETLLAPWRGHGLAELYPFVLQRAQLRYALGEFEKSAADYRWLAEHAEEKRELLEEGLKGEIASLEELLKLNPIKIQKGELQPRHAAIAGAYDRFLAHHMLDSKHKVAAANILFTSAQLYKEYGNIDEGLHRIYFYSRQFSDQKDAVGATKDAMVLLEQGARWEELRDYTEALLSKGDYKKSPILAEIRNANEFSTLRLLESLEKTKDWEKATREFAKFAEKFPESKFASQALIKSANAALETKDIEKSIERLEKATVAADTQIQLQAWLALEPFYRKGMRWKKLSETYQAILKNPKADAKTLEGTRANLASIEALGRAKFMAAAHPAFAADADIEKAKNLMNKFSAAGVEFRALRFVKSNNNPSANFQKKTAMHTKLVAELDKTVGLAPKLLAASIQVWANAEKAEMLLELAETFETSALPAALEKATDVDKKAYTDTLAGQAKELREAAAKLTAETLESSTKIDLVLDLDAKLASLAARFDSPVTLRRNGYAKLWKEIPSIEPKNKELKEAKIADLALDILKATKTESQRDALLEIAETYFHSQEPGYAFATAGALLEGKTNDEASENARRLQFAIDVARLPEPIRVGLSEETLSLEQRWQVLKWLAAEQASLAKLTEKEQKWFSELSQSILRMKLEKAPARSISSK